MSLLFSSRSLQSAIGQVSKLAVGSAIALTISGIPAVASAQDGALTVGLSYLEGKQLLTETEVSSQALSLLTDEEKIGLLDAAVLIIDADDSDYDEGDKIRALRRLAKSYSNLGAQAQAVEVLDRAVAIARDGESRYLLPVRIVPTYIEIGEVEAAENLVAQAFASGNYVQTEHLIDIAAAYSATDNSELAISTLSLAVDYLERLAALEESRVSISGIGRLAQAYDQLDDDTAAMAGLSRLVALLEPAIEKAGTGRRVSGRLATTLSQLSIAQSNQGNTDGAEALAARAMEIIRSGEENGYIVAEVAAAYGYIEDRQVAERALSEMMQLAVSDLSSTDPIGPTSALRAIAIAYDRLGDTEKSEEAIAILTDTFGDSPYMLGAILGLHVEMENAAAQEATIQKMFEMLPLLREAGLVVSDVTAGYSGLSGIVEAYVYTADDAIAQERLALLESFFTEVRFDPLHFPGQLATLARAAVQRGDDAAAVRLLAEGTQRLESDIEICERYCVSAINSLASGYSQLENYQVKQAGFDKLQQIADDNLDAEERESAINMLTLYRAIL